MFPSCSNKWKKCVTYSVAVAAWIEGTFSSCPLTHSTRWPGEQWQMEGHCARTSPMMIVQIIVGWTIYSFSLMFLRLYFSSCVYSLYSRLASFTDDSVCSWACLFSLESNLSQSESLRNWRELFPLCPCVKVCDVSHPFTLRRGLHSLSLSCCLSHS